MEYAVRRRDSGEHGWRWVIHKAGTPLNICGYALTKRGAVRKARRWMREDERARTSYPVEP